VNRCGTEFAEIALIPKLFTKLQNHISMRDEVATFLRLPPRGLSDQTTRSRRSPPARWTQR
jgi:hypothetical protein